VTFIRIYSLSASEGQSAALETALAELGAALRPIEACDQFIVGRDLADASAYTVLEFWRSADDHKASASQIPKSCFKAIMETLSRPPEVKDVDRLL
jgi:quinol monooxygenase YgiN